MPRYIDADRLNAAIEEWFDGVCVYDVSPSEAVYDFQSIVGEQPTISTDEVRGVGKWIHFTRKYISGVGDEGVSMIRCSVCDYTQFESSKSSTNYCPSCGAKMEVTSDALS